MLQTDKDKQWFASIVNYIKVGQLNWTFWSLNPDSGDTGGITNDDWKTVVAAKQQALQTIQFPLGRNTTVLTQHQRMRMLIHQWQPVRRKHPNSDNLHRCNTAGTLQKWQSWHNDG